MRALKKIMYNRNVLGSNDMEMNAFVLHLPCINPKMTRMWDKIVQHRELEHVKSCCCRRRRRCTRMNKYECHKMRKTKKNTRVYAL